MRLFASVIAALVTIVGFQNCSQFPTTAFSTSAPGALSVADGVADNSGEPASATSGTPLIHQIRAGKEIKTYATLGEIFQRVQGFRKYETGDVFELDPAVYSGQSQQAWIGTQALNDAEYSKGQATWQVPEGLILRGRIVNGVRPVVKLASDGVSNNTFGQGILYIDHSKNFVIENIDFDGGGNSVGKGGIYLNGADGFTLRHSRVMHFTQSNGVFSTGNNAGTILFENVETGFNGGDSGPEHNYYMGESSSDSYYDSAWPHREDASHTIVWRGCYSHDVYYGHTLKSRAQNNLVEGSYFRGSNVLTSGGQGEAYLADFPNGGRIIVRNNVFEKGYSGDSSNGLFVTYAMEGQRYPSASSISITHNTFVARSKFYDSQGHLLNPFGFFYPRQSPADSNFPSAIPVTVAGNLFLGFDTTAGYNDSVSLYRGSDFLELADLASIDAAFKMVKPRLASTPSVGQLSPAIPVGTVTRTGTTFGARD